MSEVWDITNIKHNWFPNDGSYPEIIRSIRSFVDDRTRTAPGRDVPSPDITDMKATFGLMRLEEGQSEPPSASGQSSAGFSVHNIAMGPRFGDGVFPEPQAYWKH
jgi:hypothetical protein